jgi:Rrf2 family protein
MKFSRTITYSIQTVLYLAEAPSGIPITCSQVAREAKMPERFLVQILRTLVQRGVLQSTCGISGGYCLAHNPENITLLDLVEAFENPLSPRLPLLEGQTPEIHDCLLKTLQRASKAAGNVLKQLSVADLMKRTPTSRDLCATLSMDT